MGPPRPAAASEEAGSARPRLMFAYRNVQRALRDDRWKLIRYPEVDRTQFFDLKADPFETTNLAGDPRLASTLADLTGRLRAEMDRFGDAAP